MRLLHIAAVVVLLMAAGCHPGPVIDTGPKPPEVGGTIAGFVTGPGNAPVAGRKVIAIDTTSGTRFDATTGVNGGYTIKVPAGTYRLDVELQGAEKIVKQPGETRINKSDLDTRRDFVISGGSQPPRG
jgi:hypothetical protein